MIIPQKHSVTAGLRLAPLPTAKQPVITRDQHPAFISIENRARPNNIR